MKTYDSNEISVLLILESIFILFAIVCTKIFIDGYPNSSFLLITVPWVIVVISWIIMCLGVDGSFWCTFLLHHKWKPVYKIVKKTIFGEEVQEKHLKFYICKRCGCVKEVEEKSKPQLDPRVKLVTEKGIDKGDYVVLSD